VQWYYKLFEQTMRGGLSRDHRSGVMPNADAIHGSLLALGELLQHTGEFLLARYGSRSPDPARVDPAHPATPGTTRRYKEVVETVLRFKDSKEKQIRRAVIVLLPRLAAFSPERFVPEYAAKALNHLISVLKHQPERGAAFAAIADMSVALMSIGCVSVFDANLPAIAMHIRESLTAAAKLKPRVTCPEALQCVGVLSFALERNWEPLVAQLLETMMLTGLSEVLVESLTQVG